MVCRPLISLEHMRRGGHPHLASSYTIQTAGKQTDRCPVQVEGLAGFLAIRLQHFPSLRPPSLWVQRDHFSQEFCGSLPASFPWPLSPQHLACKSTFGSPSGTMCEASAVIAPVTSVSHSLARRLLRPDSMPVRASPGPPGHLPWRISTLGLPSLAGLIS